jgi:hypothetical protein
MADPIPSYVDSVLLEWGTIAFTAYNGYEQLGRGVVAISHQDYSAQLLYCEREFFVKQGNTTITLIIDAYDPEWELLALFDTDQGKTRTLRIRTSDGGRHPKRIWFFEMLRRVIEEPESLPEKIPEWFWKTLEESEAANSITEPENQLQTSPGKWVGINCNEEERIHAFGS